MGPGNEGMLTANDKRLIDANEVEKVLLKLRSGYRTVAEKSAVGGCLIEIRDIPTVDAVEVVRCKDCQRARPMMFEAFYYCKRHRAVRMSSDFCSYGERKE